MAKWVRSATLDDGLNDIKTNAIRMLLVKNYTAGDSYATVIGNSIAEVVMASGDYTLSSVGSDRRLTTATKSATASGSSTGGDDLHIAFTDGASSVIWVTDETTNQVVTSGNQVNFPALTYTSSQPV